MDLLDKLSVETKAKAQAAADIFGRILGRKAEAREVLAAVEAGNKALFEMGEASVADNRAYEQAVNEFCRATVADLAAKASS